MRADRFLRLIVLLPLTFASGCLQTTYKPYSGSNTQMPQSETLLERRVDYRLTNAFYATAPSCAAIITNAATHHAVGRLVEEAVERHLATRLSRVLGGARLRKVEFTLGIDMKVASDRRVFARQARCAALVEIDLAQVQDDYMVLWAQRGLTIRLTMRRITDGKILWQARHAANRGDGGLPISIIDLPVSAARAGLVTKDPEMFASIADDAARRMMKTLPDIRGTEPSRNLVGEWAGVNPRKRKLH